MKYERSYRLIDPSRENYCVPACVRMVMESEKIEMPLMTDDRIATTLGYTNSDGCRSCLGERLACNSLMFDLKVPLMVSYVGVPYLMYEEDYLLSEMLWRVCSIPGTHVMLGAGFGKQFDQNRPCPDNGRDHMTLLESWDPNEQILRLINPIAKSERVSLSVYDMFGLMRNRSWSGLYVAQGVNLLCSERKI